MRNSININDRASKHLLSLETCLGLFRWVLVLESKHSSWISPWFQSRGTLERLIFSRLGMVYKYGLATLH